MGYCMTKQYMKYIAIGGVASQVNKELDKGARLILMIPFLQTDNWGSYTAGYNVLFEKDEEPSQLKNPEPCKSENKTNTSELKPCPFCGTEVSMRAVPLYGHIGCFEFEVRCSKCGCTINYVNNDTIYRSEDEAIANVVKAWNERKGETK